jgi:hypothetical protein
VDFLTDVTLAVYRTIAETTHAPTVADVAAQLGAAVDDVQAAFDELHTRRLLVPEPGDPTRIRMAPPFSGVSTPFRVTVRTKTYHANCVWDALGIPAALHADGMVRARDAQSKESMTLVIRNGAPKPTPCIAHFAVPAAHWWDDIIHT